MSQKHDKDEKIAEELQTEAVNEIENRETEVNAEEEDNDIVPNEVVKLKDMLARSQADFENFKMRVQRDKEDMIFFLKADIFSKVLPRVDDLERVVLSTPEELRGNALFTWVETTLKSLSKDLEKLWVTAFSSKWEKVDPDKHDVMTQVPWEDWIIVDEFVKGYMLWDRVLRHAKVVVWNWQ